MNKKELSTTRWLTTAQDQMKNYPRDPNVYVKNEYVPFNKYGSESWPTFYFRSVSRGKAKYYESYGRTEAMAKSALEKAVGKSMEAISKQVWSKNKGKGT